MKIAILCNRENSYIKIMAEGLQRMLAEIRVEGEVFYDGLAHLEQLPSPFMQYIRAPSKGLVAKKVFKYAIKEMPSFYPFLKKLQQFDAVVVVKSVPEAFSGSFFHDATLRHYLPGIPIILYDLYYLPTRGLWGKWLKDGNKERHIAESQNWGLERYDWYLCASVVSECPLPKGPQPYSIIGLNLLDGSLSPDPKEEFQALVDFENRGDEYERALQIVALKETNTKYVVLSGRYSISEIRKIYRSSSIFFLAMRESFGLPICELQACGSYVFTPYSEWAPSHWLKKDLTQAGRGELPSNFIVYDNDKEVLMKEIARIKAVYDPKEVVNNFHRHHRHLSYGDTVELKRFIGMVESGEIHSKSHEQYAGITHAETCIHSRV
ncbi:MAG: glycosyltransferase family 4 protein [Nitrospiraceae bacterium]|nr:glycosyltransferase family 4 protein [Nitrospiraceae bacterium]